MKAPILNLADVPLRPWGHGVDMPGAGTPPERYSAKLGTISSTLGAKSLGYGLVVVPPGKSAWPRHAHVVVEEMFFVLEGSGELRIGDERWPIKAGDVIACLPGGPETAHQITNTGVTDLRYLGVSSQGSPEVVHYPDSGKVAVAARIPGPDGTPTIMRMIVRTGESLEYWQDEK